MAAKTSILVFYLTLSRTQKLFRRATWATLVVVNTAGTALTCLNIFQCKPVNAAFSLPVPDSATCTDIVTLYLSSAPVNIITDCAILFLPMPILTAISLPKKQRTILVITFGFGIFVTVVDVVRIAYLQEAQTARLKNVQSSERATSSTEWEENDFSWYAASTFMWSAVEVNVGIMCACVPALKPLVSRFLPNLLHTAGEDVSEPLGVTPCYNRSAELVRTQRIRTGSGVQCKETGTESPESQRIDMMEFLTGADPAPMPRPQRTQSNWTNATRRASTNRPAFVDFVQQRHKKKSMVELSGRESIFPLAMVTGLFFLWGFAYGLLNVLNTQFQGIARMSSGQFVGIHSAYWAGYFVAPLTFGRYVLRNWGFKACYTVGLAIYACGTLIFWPSAVLTSFPAFLVSNFIAGLGLATLEVAANPFIALCGPPQYAEARLLFSQAFQGIGSVVSPILAKRVLFRDASNAASLVDVQWTYLGIALCTIFLGLGYYYVPLPEASDQDLEEAANRLDTAHTTMIKGIKVTSVTLGLAVFCMWCYVGAQEAVSTSFDFYVGKARPDIDVTSHSAIAHTSFSVARMLTAGLALYIKPRYLLLFFLTGTIVITALCMNFEGTTPVILIIILYFFEGPIFPLVFAIPLRSLGRHTKNGAAFLTAAISGGAVIAPISNAVANDRGIQYSFSVLTAVFAFGALFPIYLNAFPPARKLADPVKPVASDNHSAAEAWPLPPIAQTSRSSKAFRHRSPRREQNHTQVGHIEDSR